MDIRIAVPLYRCADCGFVTTASMENAAQAHEVGSPECSGEIALIVDFSRAPVPGPPLRRRRRPTRSAAQPGGESLVPPLGGG